MRPGFVLPMAARELRAEPRRLLLLVGTVAVGVAALVAVNSFTANLRDSVARQARTLLGADLSATSRQALSPDAQGLLDSLARGADTARVTSFAAMAFVPRTEGTRLVQVAAVSGRYPFYGEIRTQPRNAWDGLHAGPHAIVDPSLLTALNARVGDTLALGEGRFIIRGSIESAPNQVGFRFAFGPRIYIPASYLKETGLLGFGARVQYELFFKLQPGVSAQALADRFRGRLQAERVRLRTVADDQENLTRVLSQLTGYLGLVALVALLLGGIGVASAVVVLLRRRSPSIAVLRCLGATSRRVLLVYLIEASVMGLAGSLMGALLGVLLQRALPGLLADLIPVEVAPEISWEAVGLGIGMGLWVALTFTLIPLLGIRSIAPLAALRRPYESEHARRDVWWALAALAPVLSLVGLAIHLVGSRRQGVVFAGAIALTLVMLWLVSRTTIRLLNRRIPPGWPYAWRQGLANLYRPANQTVTLVLAIGFGAFLLGTLYLVQYNLLQQLRSTGGPRRPNLVLFDIQPDQFPAVQQELRRASLPSIGPTPIVPMRISSIRGRSVTTLLRRDSAGGDRLSDSWALRREYRSTYRDSIVSSERLVAGDWFQNEGSSPVRISVEQEVAGELGVAVGDEIVWDVQGVRIPSRVANLREVDWARFEPNFFVVFAPGALERAPQSLVTLTRIETAAGRGRFQRRLAEQFPNVSTLDLSLLQESLERLVDRVTVAIRFMALFSLGVGALVLVGALATSRFQRIREGALLRTLGATRGQVFRVIVAEYLSLGLIATAIALMLSSAAGWGLARFVFEGTFTLPFPAMAGLGLTIVMLTVLIGLANSREVVRRPPLEVLRHE